jgi:hypothetical protein
MKRTKLIKGDFVLKKTRRQYESGAIRGDENTKRCSRKADKVEFCVLPQRKRKLDTQIAFSRACYETCTIDLVALVNYYENMYALNF